MTRVLITGFEPFGGATVNPSGELAKRLAGEWDTAILPVEFDGLRKRVQDLFADPRPTHVISLGVSGKATGVTFERVALNLADARIADNAGVQPVDGAVIPGGPVAFLTTLPVRTMMKAVKQAGLPAELSLSAGSYVCNALMYTLLYEAAKLPAQARPRCGFIHVPEFETLSLEAGERAIRAVLQVLS